MRMLVSLNLLPMRRLPFRTSLYILGILIRGVKQGLILKTMTIKIWNRFYRISKMPVLIRISKSK